jgi:hypothetical protein
MSGAADRAALPGPAPRDDELNWRWRPPGAG